MRYKRIVGALALTLGLLVCATQLSAQAFAGSYALYQVNGQPLPVVTDEENGCREEVLAATLIIEANGDWRMDYTERETCGTEVEEDEEDESGRYITEGNTIIFSDDDESDSPADEIDIDELGIGTLSGDVLSVTLEDRRTVLSFRR